MKLPARVVAQTLLMLVAELNGGELWAGISSVSGTVSGAREAQIPASTVPILTVPLLVMTAPPSTGQQLYLAFSSSLSLTQLNVKSQIYSNKVSNLCVFYI